MSGVTVFPALAQLTAWPTEHLTEAADHWEAVARRCYGVANQVWRDALSVNWQGAAADLLRNETHSDMLTTSAAADQLHEAAKVARSGASDLYASRSRVRYAVEDARTAGFDVGEDLSVTDRSRSGSTAQRLARQAQAQAFAGEIRQRAAQLVRLDQHVADHITASVVGIRHTFPSMPARAVPPNQSRVQAVDHHWKQDPTPAPTPESGPPNGPTADDIRRVLDKLPQGENPRVREVRSPADLENLWQWAQQNGVEIPNGYGDPSKGTRYRLPDGTTIGQRWAAESTGQPVIDVRYPSKGDYTKVHLNPRGGVPDIPAPPRVAPPARTPVEPPTATPAPSRAPPIIGIGPVPPESVPHPVHPPYSHHGPPVLGKDELGDLDEFTPG
ncbi:hypothetical protein [Mycobacterium sp. TY815]|uniref:hypothetical protein n=1 Tax=Mycobacterium sp. TY815 TaxID=3050581 RepID=UPI0027425F66|nr:hypothetical protein [Mycobacterium sp. TY815]MDP7702999.1 hypothetical protein [Mycobacterium sp. TY815]